MSERYTLHHGDCVAVMRSMPDNSVDSIVTDPPYGLEFMGKEWDKLTRNLMRSDSEADKQRLEEYGDEYQGRRSRLPDLAGAAKYGNEMQAWHLEWAREALRVLKPGGHLLAFSGSRTYHRMAVAIEDAGFEIRDQIMWIYGSGFPKSLDVSKAIDKSDAVEARKNRNLTFTHWMRSTSLTRSKATEVLRCSGVITENGTMAGHFFAETEAGQPAVATKEIFDVLRPYLPAVPDFIEKLVEQRTVESQNFKNRQIVGSKVSGIGSAFGDGEWASGKAQEVNVTAPATSQAQQWQGWGTALKPAHEPIVVARKPLQGTVAANVLAHGVGALNIDGCRVGSEERFNTYAGNKDTGFTASDERSDAAKGLFAGNNEGGSTVQGRWPANVIHDGSDEVVALFPQSNGGAFPKKSNIPTGVHYEGGWGAVDNGERTEMGSGSAARFFYCAKANKRDRNEGLDGFTAKFSPTMNDGIGGKEHNPETATKKLNHHPTVKPTDLMRYLIRLVTPQGATILDPFMGSGSTGKAAMFEGVNFIGIEQDAEYLSIAKARIEYALNKLAEEVLFPREEPTTEQLVTDDQQLPLFTQDTA